MDTLTDRIARLEKQNRRVKIAFAVMVIAIGAALLCGQAGLGDGAKMVTAQQFVLVDKSGKVRAMLGIANGEPGLVLRDK